MLLAISKKSFKIQINNEWWTVFLFTHTSFVKLHGDGVLGITEYNHDINFREIHFRSPTTKDTIAHELNHAFLSHYNPSGKKWEGSNGIEEHVCEQAGKNYKKIYDMTDEIFKEFKKATK